MSLESGGYAEKLGNRYEANWLAYLLLQLLEEKILSIIVEPIGDDEVGVDIVVEHHNGDKEFHQCKAGNTNKEYWTVAQLSQTKILNNALFQIQRGMNEFHLVSPLSSKQLSDLGDSALNTSENPRDFYKYQINIGQQRKKIFNELCKYLGFDTSKELDLEKALAFLQKFKITTYILNRHTMYEMEDKATALFSDKPKKLLSFLKNYTIEFNKLRTRITTHSLLNALKNEGFQPRIKPNDERILPIIENISLNFIKTIKPYLISNSLIERKEAIDVINSLEDHAVSLIKAEAGIGKTALILDIHLKLQSQGVISIPIRLDRNRPENNSDAFGEKLGLPSSPVLCFSQFAKIQKVVIILDQLDAIRWTATHSNNALQVCQELVRQVIALRKGGADINIILACRDFDLDEDVALKSWINELDYEVAEVILSSFDTSTVTQLIEPYEKFENLPDEKKKILTIPLWLSIYLAIAEREKTAPQFNNKLELVKRFWENKINEVKQFGVNEESANQLINELVVLMSSKSRLSVSENIIAISSSQTLNALLSVGVLNKQSQQISFRHQALLDYQVGKRLFNSALNSTEQLIEDIGDYSQQTLTKREHLKYALNMLLDYDQSIFCTNTQALLTSENIRFHLKYLIFNSLKELRDLKSPAKKLIDRLISDKNLLSKFLSNSCYGNNHIITYLSDSGVISDWLNSQNVNLIDEAIKLLGSTAETDPSLVVAELKPFIGESTEWNNRVYRGLCWNIEDDSDSMFQVRKEIINQGYNAGYINWKTLAKKTPTRVIDLIEILLQHYKPALCVSKYEVASKVEKLSHRDTWTESDLSDLNDISLLIPEETLSRLLIKITEIVNGYEDTDTTYNWFYKDKHSNYDVVSSITNGVFSIVVSCGKKLSNTPDILLELLNPYLSNNNPVVTHLIAKLLYFLSTKYSDLVIKWLLENTKSRFICGNDYIEPKWILPAKLIEKFSEKCSDILFKQLEHAIYYFKSVKNMENIKWRLEATRKGMFYSIWGETQYFLLSKLSQSCIDIKTEQLIIVLNRKFNAYTESDFCSSYNGSGGIVTSPLPLANLLSDKAWKKLILAPKERVNKGTWIQRGKDSISESSIEQFSRSLDFAVKNQPIRFANLALSLPPDINEKYINGFYWGLTKTNLSEVNEQYTDEWKLCPPELTEAVINHFNNENGEYALVRLLESRITEKGWSEKAQQILIGLALNAKDPEPNKLNVRNIKKTKLANETDVDSLRGIAYRGISHLFWDNKGLAKELQYLIQSAIQDPHPAVNITALDMLLPMYNYDEDFAIQNFLLLCNKDLRMACGHGAHYFFNQSFDSNYKEDFINLVLDMLKSPFEDVRKEASRQVFARWFFNDLFQEQVFKLLQGDLIEKEGIASVLAQLLQEDKYHELIHKIPTFYSQLVNDDNKEILRTVGHCISNDNFWNKSISKELFGIFVNSKAVFFCLFELFTAIEKYSGSLLEYQEQLLQLVQNITSLDNADTSLRDMHIRESSLINVLQRLYDEATEDEDSESINICLDIWDKLLHSKIYSVINASKELDKGLLS